MTMDMDEEKHTFIALAGNSIHGIAINVAPVTLLRRFKAHFGVSPRQCVHIWWLAEERLLRSNNFARRDHLLWTLNLLKTDDTEAVLSGRWNVDEKTIRKWIYIVLDVLKTLGAINWDNRLLGNTNCEVFVTVDGTDFRIKEPTPFSSSWFSHKFKGPGLRYEVAICITTGWIVWLNGPYKAGEWPDLSIARHKLHTILGDNECYIADAGYCERALVPEAAVTYNEKIYMAYARSRHETINRLFKLFRVVSNTFEREPCKHGLFIHSIANIIQVGIQMGEVSPFDVQEMIAEPNTWPRW